MRFTHVNLIAQDWHRLAVFYETVFGCKRVPPERDLSGRWLEKATGVTAAKIAGIHLRLPGSGDSGPTLEIFQYGSSAPALAVRPDTPGFSHIAFAVEDVEKTAETIFQAGGRPIGELTVREIEGVGRLTMWYVTDPEGNIIELQNIQTAHSNAIV
jgi:predicted enzyme related to lactoylglutathione lyase